MTPFRKLLSNVDLPTPIIFPTCFIAVPECHPDSSVKFLNDQFQITTQVFANLFETIFELNVYGILNRPFGPSRFRFLFSR